MQHKLLHSVCEEQRHYYFVGLQLGEQQFNDEQLRQELIALRTKRLLRTAAVVQDLADSLLAVNEVRGESYSGFVVPPLQQLIAHRAIPYHTPLFSIVVSKHRYDRLGLCAIFCFALDADL